MLGKRLHKEKHVCTARAIDQMTGSDTEPTNESSFNKFSDGASEKKAYTMHCCETDDTQLPRHPLKCIEQHHSEVFSDNDAAESVDSWDWGTQEPIKRQRVSDFECAKSTFEKIEKVVLGHEFVDVNTDYLAVSNNRVQA